ncbi:MAG: ADP-glyceromanno-heptose 6-epimerase [Kiritimatiellae bacterium]|nr:ADP-glyceromanno-heptose 6-epimerase [Kiritimatiellia bacterium]MDD5521516.1 ADP-glyceromanno-heptose 6-epimerase [Kiritimatiellia bacterium]
MAKSFIVTGGAGFIGCNIVKALNEKGNNNIIVVDDIGSDKAKEKNLKAVRFHKFIGINEFRKLFVAGKMKNADVIFHMGACSSTTETNEEYLIDNNFIYTRQLCEWCLRHNSRFIYASSAATYGDGSLGYSDNDMLTPQLKPLNLYGRSKQMFDLWALENKMLNKIVGLKYFNVYGPHEDHKGDMRSVINKAYDQILQTGELKLFKSYKPDYRDGEQERDFIHVKDAVKVSLFFEEHRNVSGIFNCGTGKARTWIDLAKAVFTAMEQKPQIKFIEMPLEIRDKYQYHTQADMTKLRSVGYNEPFTSIEEGAKEYVHNYLSIR